MQIKLDGKYKRRDGVKVRRVLAVDCVGEYPVAVEFENGVVESYTLDGKFLLSRGSEKSDLIEYDEREEWHLDALLVVENLDGGKFIRHFAGIQDGIVKCFDSGTDSKTADFGRVSRWDTARLATPADIERLAPKPEAWWAEKRK